MSDMPKLEYVDLTHSMRRVISAHKAVVEGITTHAEKERAKRQAEHHKMEEAQKLAAGKPVRYDRL
jgi:hypothetical protein